MVRSRQSLRGPDMSPFESGLEATIVHHACYMFGFENLRDPHRHRDVGAVLILAGDE